MCAENLVRVIWQRNHVTSATMVALLFFLLRLFLLRLLVSPFGSISRLEAETLHPDASPDVVLGR